MAAELKQLKDEELLKKIQEFQNNAFVELVKRHNYKFYSLAYRTLFDKNLAEDIVQESFLKLWKNPSIWNPKKNTKFTTWFYRIIINSCYDTNRKKLLCKENTNIEIEKLKNIEYLDKVNEKKKQEQQHINIKNAIISLPKRQQIALNLCFYQGLKNKEAADIMKTSLKSLQSLIMRAKANLKKELIK